MPWKKIKWYLWRRQRREVKVNDKFLRTYFRPYACVTHSRGVFALSRLPDSAPRVKGPKTFHLEDFDLEEFSLHESFANKKQTFCRSVCLSCNSFEAFNRRPETWNCWVKKKPFTCLRMNIWNVSASSQPLVALFMPFAFSTPEPRHEINFSL